MYLVLPKSGKNIKSGLKQPSHMGCQFSCHLNAKTKTNKNYNNNLTLIRKQCI